MIAEGDTLTLHDMPAEIIAAQTTLADSSETALAEIADADSPVSAFRTQYAIASNANR